MWGSNMRLLSQGEEMFLRLSAYRFILYWNPLFYFDFPCRPHRISRILRRDSGWHFHVAVATDRIRRRRRSLLSSGAWHKHNLVVLTTKWLISTSCRYGLFFFSWKDIRVLPTEVVSLVLAVDQGIDLFQIRPKLSLSLWAYNSAWARKRCDKLR